MEHTQTTAQCNEGHDLTPENTYTRPDGGRRCRLCLKAACDRYKARQMTRTLAPELISRLHDLYVDQALSQRDVAAALDVSQPTARHYLIAAGIALRDLKAAHPHLSGEENSHWKGDLAGYTAFHGRVNRAKGKPKHCTACDKTDPHAIYDWANLTGHYEDVEDYARMCRPCHRNYDNSRARADRKETP